MSSSPISPYRAQQVSKWRCTSCGNYNSLKKKKCPKCNSKNTQMSFDDIEMLHELQESQTIQLNRSCFTKDSKYIKQSELRWRKYIIKNKTCTIMEHESNANPCEYSQLQQCPCAKRAVFIQNLYKNWCKAHQPTAQKTVLKKKKKRKTVKKAKKRLKPKSDITLIAKEHTLTPTKIKDMDKPSLSIADIICKKLKNYGLSQLIEDCNHIDLQHALPTKHKKQNKYLNIFNFFKSELGECIGGECNILFRSNRNRAADADVLHRKRIYYGFVHAKDVAIITTLDTFHSFWFHSYNLYKVDAEKSYKRLNSLDTEAVTEEVKEEKKINVNVNQNENQNINTSKFITTTQIKEAQIKQIKCFEFGEHFEYWQFYEKYDNFIPKTYATLREELFNNNIHKIDKIIYDDIKYKVDLLITTSTIRKMRAIRNFYNSIAGIRENDVITKEHLICIMIYTNHNEIQRKFKETLRLPTNIKLMSAFNESIYHEKYMQLKHKNSEIANWCRLLFESVRFWGTIMTENDFFFHGIDTTLLFDKFYAAFKNPISTSTNICVAQTFGDGDRDAGKGIIIKVSCASEKSMIPFLDVSFISDFRMESERLFYGADLNIIDIYYQNLRFDYMLRALSLFQCIITGGFFTQNKKLINTKNQKRLISLIENYLKYHNKQELIYPKKKKNKKVNFDENASSNKRKNSYQTKQVFPQRPLSKVKSGSNLTEKVKKKKKRATVSTPDNKVSHEEKYEERLVAMYAKKKRKYHHQLFDFCISSRQNSDIWLCRTEILGRAILHRLQKYFVNFTEDAEGANTGLEAGNFVLFWKQLFDINIKYSQEFDWAINKKNLDTFMNLPSGDLIQSPRYLYTLINNESNSLSDIQFYAECCRWSKDDPGWSDFYWNVEKLPIGVSEIQVIIDVCCQEDNDEKSDKNNRIISHDIYEGEWMNLQEEQSYFGGKAFAVLEEFYDVHGDGFHDQHRRKSEPMSTPPNINQFRWKMSVRVSTIAYIQNNN